MRINDQLSNFKNEQVLKDAQVATLQTQLENERNRADLEKTRFKEEL